MNAKLTLTTSVSYADVDRHEVMLLPRIFKLLQEVALMHASQFGVGTRAAAMRAETWVLNRIATRIERYPRHNEALRIETWSSGIRAFRGFREFRVFDAAQQPIIAASSVWLYLSLATKTLLRVPAEIADHFPVGSDDVAWPALEKLRFETPAPDAVVVPIRVRYSDFDINEHVNNAAYFDFVQSALVATGRSPHPRAVQLYYGRAISADVTTLDVRLASHDRATDFSIEAAGVVFAQGRVEN